MKRLGVGGALFLLVGGVAAVLWWLTRSPGYGLPPNPYGLTASQEARVIRYFADAAHHQNYQISVTTLHQWLVDKRPVLMIDVRQPYGQMGYQSGHIPGAVNIPLQWMGEELEATRRYTRTLPFVTDAGTTRMDRITFFPLPRREPIVVMCYDGNGGEMTPVLLRLLGYSAYGLKDGVALWNPALNVWPARGTTGAGGDLPLATGASPVALKPAATGPDILGPALASRVSPFFTRLNHPYPAGYAFPWTILPGALYAALAAPHPPQVIDLRSPKAFQAGHIAGSVNIPFALLGGNLNRLNPHEPVVLVSQSLQSAAQANAVLRLLGYRSYVLKQGLASWNHQENHIPPPHHYPIVEGP
ncbi:Rhodanese domain protein [Sulfobacillus acidophilus TPY]|uniref:Rhodanese-like protein n=1 Tax=Sulfobacillus acidophilus (strain ATCC 700253 / DSM 10332 / NAL) TaxID=679936 RepID=G8TSF6_SULAD|nr:Rhodanese domain protein [Sulfobacillus acidophilus TPY]AEW06648.1 Rhodanese-like protein [Sulfobacillus acidophilus DSM 10332]